MIENTAVQAERERQQGSMDDGVLDGADIVDGMAFVGYPLPAMFFKPVYMLTAYEQGWLLGALWKRWTKGEMGK